MTKSYLYPGLQVLATNVTTLAQQDCSFSEDNRPRCTCKLAVQVPAATQARHELAGLEQLVDLLQERAQAQAQLHQAEQVSGLHLASFLGSRRVPYFEMQ